MAISLTSEFKDLNLNLWTVILVYAQNCMSFSALEDSSTIKLYTERKKKYSNGPSIIMKIMVIKSRSIYKTT